MNLLEVKNNTICVVKCVNIAHEQTKLRILELGLVSGVHVVVKAKSIFKHTLLIAFANSCFTLKDNLAKQIEVEYA